MFHFDIERNLPREPTSFHTRSMNDRATASRAIRAAPLDRVRPSCATDSFE
jgi:hypothetical protein